MLEVRCSISSHWDGNSRCVDTNASRTYGPSAPSAFARCNSSVASCVCIWGRNDYVTSIASKSADKLAALQSPHPDYGIPQASIETAFPKPRDGCPGPSCVIVVFHYARRRFGRLHASQEPGTFTFPSFFTRKHVQSRRAISVSI
jgi:hypothetical protein